MQSPIIDDDAAHASARVVEGAVNLAKAEIHLAKAELHQAVGRAKTIGQKAAVAGALLWIAMSIAQVALAVICLSPLLISVWEIPVVAASLALSIGLSTVFGVLGAYRMKAAFEPAKPAPIPPKTYDDVAPGHAMYPRGI